MAKYTKTEIAEARERALALLPRPASEREATPIYCVLHKVSKSGTSREISFYMRDDGDLTRLDHLISQVCTYSDRSTAYPHGKEGLRVGGCGMDMGFSVVYHFASSLYGAGEVRTGREGYLLRAVWL